MFGSRHEKHAGHITTRQHLCTVVILAGIGLVSAAFGAGRVLPPLDPPLKHWLYQLPETDQMDLASVTVQVQDELGAPVPKAAVLAHCRPWHYICSVKADNNGRATLRGPLGDWTVYASGSGYLGVERDVMVASDCDILVASARSLTLRPVDIAPPGVARELSYGRPAVALDAEDIPNPGDRRLSLGTLSNGVLALSGTPRIKGWLWITRGAAAGQPGLALGCPYDTTEPGKMLGLDSDVSKLAVHFDGFGQEMKVNIRFTNLDHVCRVGYVPYYVPPEGGDVTIWVTPGTYRVDATVPGAGKNIVYLPRRLRFETTSRHELRYGTAFTAEARVLTWTRSRLNLWFDVIDTYGTYLQQIPSDDTYVRLTQGRNVIYEGPAHQARARHLQLDLAWEPCWQEDTPISYEYRISNAATGDLHATGNFPSDPGVALAAGNLPIAHESDHFELRLLDLPPERARNLAESLEAALQWLSTRYAGPVSPANRQRWPLESKSPVGVGWSGGNSFSVNVYGGSRLEPQLPEGSTFVLFHELGHCYQASPPHHQARGMGSTTCESNASLLAAYCMKAVQGDRGLQYMQWRYARPFFDKLLSDSPGGTPDAGDYDFLYFYIHNRYGQAVHRDFQRIMYRSEGNCETILLSADFLVSEAERSAAMYSFLCGDNLAWLYRWIGEDVTDEVVEQALAYFAQQGAAIPALPRAGL